MYNYYQQPMQQNRPPQLLKGHPVSSLEEVKATSIDFDGTIFYFPDIANKRIYTKVVGLDGIASLNMYQLAPIPEERAITGDFITRQEFEQTISELVKSLQQQQTQVQQPPPQNFKEVF